MASDDTNSSDQTDPGHFTNQRRRTFELVATELAAVRAAQDRHLAAARLQRAGESCVELEQLMREYVALRSARRPPL